MSVTIAKKTFRHTLNSSLANDMRLWIVAQIPELSFFKSGKSDSNTSWWLYKFEGTNYGIGFRFYSGNGYLQMAVYHNVTDETIGDGSQYSFYTKAITENDTGLVTSGAIVIRTTSGIMIQQMTYTGIPNISFLYVGKTESKIMGQIAVDGYFSLIGYFYISGNTVQQNYSSGSSFSFKINNETPATWRKGALVAIRPTGTEYGTAGSIVASAVYGVTNAAWIGPVRINSLYALDGPVLPPYHQEVTLGERTMIRIAGNIAVEK